MRHKAVLLVLICLAGCCGWLNATRFARWSTSMGGFTAELYDAETPITAGNFISLANSGFYNGLIFHRVVQGFVIQDGCPYGTGYGGPGYTIPDEVYPGFHHDQAGILAMARTSAPNSAGSQYYITLAPAPHLDGNYAIFGKVVQGLDVVLAIGDVPVDANDHPITTVDIDTLRVLDLAIGTITPPVNETVQCVANQPQMFIVEASSVASITQYAWYVDDTLIPGALDFIFESPFAPGAHTVECEVSSADWSYTVHWDLYAEGSANDDMVAPLVSDLKVVPNPFQHSARISLKASGNTPPLVSIYDIRGRKVYCGTASGRGVLSLDWNGTDDTGKRCPQGIYIIRCGGKSTRCLMF